MTRAPLSRTPRATNGRAFDRRAGAVAGIVGAIIYTVFIETVTVVSNGPGSFFYPLRQIGAVVLGPRALDAGYDLLTATIVGTIVHVAIAAAFGIVLSWARARLLAPGAAGTIALGVAAGLSLYAVDVFGMFPAAFPWFLANDRLTQSVGHALFGGIAGAWLARRSPA